MQPRQTRNVVSLTGPPITVSRRTVFYPWPKRATDIFGHFKNASAKRKITISPEQEALPELDIGTIELQVSGRKNAR